MILLALVGFIIPTRHSTILKLYNIPWQEMSSSADCHVITFFYHTRLLYFVHELSH